MSTDPIDIAVTQQSGAMSKASPPQWVSLQDINKFQTAYADAAQNISQAKSHNVSQAEGTRVLSALISPLSNLNEHSAQLKAEAESAIGENLKPSELMMLTMHTHQFMFHCQLTANVANRSSDGVQQLFRQQS